MSAEQRRRWREKGLCGHCGGKRDRDDRTACRACRQKASDSSARRAERLFAEGLCIVCGKNPHDENRKACALCRSRQSEYDHKRVASYRPAQLRTGAATTPIISAAVRLVDATRKLEVKQLPEQQLQARQAARVAMKQLFSAVDHYQEVRAVLSTTA